MRPDYRVSLVGDLQMIADYPDKEAARSVAEICRRAVRRHRRRVAIKKAAYVLSALIAIGAAIAVALILATAR
jgi:hypothetical protein